MSKFDDRMMKPIMILILGMFVTIVNYTVGMVIICVAMVYTILLTILYFVSMYVKQNKKYREWLRKN